MIYKKEIVWIYYADIIVENKVIVEIKTVDKINNIHQAQLLNYRKIFGIRAGLIINSKLEYKRLIV